MIFWGELIGYVLEALVSFFFPEWAERFFNEHPLLDRIVTIVMSLFMLAGTIFLGFLIYRYFTHHH